MIKNIIFDLDGTLLDTREGILESVKYAAKELEIHQWK
jgi:phosphoglycolate phosphatase-like HAD superfamily hydrolase